MDQKAVVMLPSELLAFEELCLHKITSELDHYPVSILCLLPCRLRQKLLCRLPAADICKLEESHEFMDGVDIASVWKMLQDYFVNLLFCRTPSWSAESFGPFLESKYLLPSPKENFLAMISKLLFLTTNNEYECGCPEYFKHGKWKIVAALMFGFPSAKSNNKFITVPTSGKSPVYVPYRYANRLTKTQEDISEMISQVIGVFNCGPKMIHFCADEQIDDSILSVDDQVLAPFLSRVEAFGVRFLNTCYEESDSYCNLLKKTVSSQLNGINESAPPEYPLRYLRFEGYQTNHKLVLENLKESGLLSYSLHCNWKEAAFDDKKIPYTKLKKVEIIVEDRSCELAEHSIEGRLDLRCDTLAAILYCQEELEDIHLEELSSMQAPRDLSRYVYSGFEKLYFCLPLIISKPSFKSLKLEGCSLPLNAAQNIIRTFLCTPTTHTQSLDMNKCSLYDVQTVSLPEGCPECPTIPDNCPCVNGNLKSLSLFVNNGLSSFTWLLNHPNMKLKHLSLFCNPLTRDKAVILKMAEDSDKESLDEESLDDESEDEPSIKRHKVEVEGKSSEHSPKDGVQQLCELICKLEQPEELDVCFIAIDTRNSHCRQGIERVLLLPTLTTLSFMGINWERSDPNILEVLAHLITQHAAPGRICSLRTLQFSCMRGVCPFEKLKLLFEAIFSFPQLSNFTLDITRSPLPPKYQEGFDNIMMMHNQAGQQLAPTVNTQDNSIFAFYYMSPWYECVDSYY